MLLGAPGIKKGDAGEGAEKRPTVTAMAVVHGHRVWRAAVHMLHTNAAYDGMYKSAACPCRSRVGGLSCQVEISWKHLGWSSTSSEKRAISTVTFNYASGILSFRRVLSV